LSSSAASGRSVLFQRAPFITGWALSVPLGEIVAAFRTEKDSFG